jgi:nucleoside diphosphate kinase
MSAVKIGVGAAATAGALWYLTRPSGPPKNAAFVFVKPHAVTDKTNKTARDRLIEKGMKITGEGDIKSEEIDKKKLIDQHYYAIASKATILKPAEVNIPRDKFKAHFGKDWDTLLKNGECANALEACEFFGCDAGQLSKAWGESKKAGNLVKLGGGFYCGLVNMNGKSKYVLNAFFMDMRNKFTAPGGSIHWYTVEWDEATLSWADFRGKILGPTDPKDAPKDSLRGEILQNWAGLGLKSEPNVGDNGMHASASPFEAMSERMNWLNRRCDQDSFCKAMKAAGIPEKTIEEWSVDPQVKIDASGKKGSLYDAVEDLDSKACVEKLKSLYAMQ